MLAKSEVVGDALGDANEIGRGLRGQQQSMARPRESSTRQIEASGVVVEAS